MLKKGVIPKYKLPYSEPKELSDQMTNWEMGLFLFDQGSWTVMWFIRVSECFECCGVVRRATGK